MRKHTSVITDDWDHCYICGAPPSDEHHCIGGPNRKWSEKYHLVVPLCHICHSNLHDHDMKRQYLQQIGQLAFEEHYPDENFIKIFGRNYKWQI